MSDNSQPQWDFIRDDGRTSSWRGWLWTMGAGALWFLVMATLRSEGVTVVRESFTSALPSKVFAAFSNDDQVSTWCECGSLKFQEKFPNRRLRFDGLSVLKNGSVSKNEILLIEENGGTRIRWIWSSRRSPLSASFRGVQSGEQIVGPILERALDRLIHRLESS